MQFILNFDSLMFPHSKYAPFATPSRAIRHSTYQRNGYSFRFNGKENDPETYGDGNALDFGARIYDSRLGKWLGCDPKTGNYPSWSPYHFGYNNPIVTIDPDGEENIVVVGSQNDNTAANKLMFVNQGLRQLRWYKKHESSESRSLVLFTAGYTAKQIDRITRIAQKRYGATVIWVNSTDELTNYVNSKSQENHKLTQARTEDPVTNIDAFSHGVVGSIEFGYKMGARVETAQRFDASSASDLNSSAFSGDAVFTSYACRTGLGNSDINYFRSPGEDMMYDQSLAQQMSNTLGIKVKAFASRSDYSGTLGTATQRQLMKLGHQFDGGLSKSLKSKEMIDGADLRPNGAVNPVTGGNTPIGVPNDLKTFNPQKK